METYMENKQLNSSPLRWRTTKVGLQLIRGPENVLVTIRPKHPNRVLNNGYLLFGVGLPLHCLAPTLEAAKERALEHARNATT